MKIGIDIGGTNIRIGFNQNNTIIKSTTIKSDGNNFKKAIEDIVNTITSVCRKEEVNFIGIGCPGPFFPNTSILSTTPNLKDWNGKDPKNEILKSFPNATSIFINDANLQGINEYQIHKGNPLIFLTFSTGIGAVALIDGKVLNGFSGSSMEINNAIPDYKYFNSFQNSGIEFFCSGNNIPKRLKEYGIEVENAKQAFDLLNTKNPKVIEYFKEFENKIIQFLATLIYVINPQKIVVNGPLVQNNKELFNEIFSKTIEVTKSITYKTEFIISDNDVNKLLLTASNLDLIYKTI